MSIDRLIEEKTDTTASLRGIAGSSDKGALGRLSDSEENDRRERLLTALQREAAGGVPTMPPECFLYNTTTGKSFTLEELGLGNSPEARTELREAYGRLYKRATGHGSALTP